MLTFPDHVQGLIFDCDGTLVDTMPLHKHLWNELLAEHGVTVPDGFIDSHTGKPTSTIVEIINGEQGTQIDPIEFREEKERRFLTQADNLQPIAPVVATAKDYLGKLSMAVVSGGVRKNVEHSLRAIGALEWFPVVLTASDPLTAKPAPDLFLEAARLLGVEPGACPPVDG